MQAQRVLHFSEHRDSVCGYEVQKLPKLSHYSKLRVHVCTCTCSHTCELPILYRQITKLWIMNVDAKSKRLFKFGSIETLYVDMKFNSYSIHVTHM